MNEFEALKYLDVSHEVHGGANDESRIRGRSYSPSLNVAPEPGDWGGGQRNDGSSPGDAGGGKDSSESRVRKRPIEEEIPSVDDGMIVDPSEDTIIVDSDGTRSMSRGSKRLLDNDDPSDEVTLAADSMSRFAALKFSESFEISAGPARSLSLYTVQHACNLALQCISETF